MSGETPLPCCLHRCSRSWQLVAALEEFSLILPRSAWSIVAWMWILASQEQPGHRQEPWRPPGAAGGAGTPGTSPLAPAAGRALVSRAASPPGRTLGALEMEAEGTGATIFSCKIHFFISLHYQKQHVAAKQAFSRESAEANHFDFRLLTVSRKFKCISLIRHVLTFMF